MKKTVFAVACAATVLLVGCEKLEMPETQQEEQVSEKTRDVTFKVKGDFESMTRATAVNGSSMTDVLVLDYVGGELVQQVHQGDNTAADFGSPTLSLAMGSHELYFVCSMGSGAVVNTEAHKVTWSIPRDTFWKKVTKSVTANTGGSATVTLDRVSTRLTVNIEDAIPVGTAKLEIQPSTWYYGVDYLTGNGTDTKSDAFTITIPSSYAGRTNTQVGIYGMALATEFTTNVTLTVKDDDNNVLATETITGAPMQKNRSTDYTGTLFLSENVYGMSVNDEWGTAYNGSWN